MLVQIFECRIRPPCPRSLTVVSSAAPDGVELLLEPNDNPAAKAFQQSLHEQGIPVTSFGVDDIHGICAKREQTGVVFRQKPTKQGPVTIAVIEDTCGNLLELTQK